MYRLEVIEPDNISIEFVANGLLCDVSLQLVDLTFSPARSKYRRLMLYQGRTTPGRFLRMPSRSPD